MTKTLLAALLVLLLALTPRLLWLDQVATVDEPAPWYPRTIRFLQALQSGHFEQTYQIGHPGVTTMWLGSLGLLAQRRLAGFGLLTDTDQLLQLAVLRTPTALVNALAVLLGYLLLRRLLPALPALLAALLWAADPFLVAHARVFHLDGLLASFMTLALLALLAAFALPRPPDALPAYRPWLLVLSGVCAGLAFLTKVPSVALVPTALVVAAAAGWCSGGTLQQRGWIVARALLLWGLVALATIVLLWPALWVAPAATLRQMLETARLEAGEGHSNGNFFWGQPDDTPGPLFYPVVLALRLTPWAWLGLLLLPLVFWRAPELRRSLSLLALFGVLFLVMVTLSPKKFDRYALPVFPALDILAACGLAQGLQTSRARNVPGAVLAGGTLALAGATLWLYYPNYLSYYNPLAGGGAMAEYALPVGWGEGIDEARAWLNALPASEKLAVASRSNALLGPRARFKIVSFDDVPAGPADFPNYVLLYVSNVQRRRLTPNAQWYFDNAVPAHVVRLHGVDYAWIYQVPPPVPRPLPADFGPAIRLRGYAQNLAASRGPLRLALFWESRAVPAADYLLFAHLIGPDGRRYAQLDLSPGGAPGTSNWQPGRYAISGLELPIPAAAPPGRYRVMLGLYNPADGSRLPLAGQPAADPTLAGSNALELTSFELR